MYLNLDTRHHHLCVFSIDFSIVELFLTSIFAALGSGLCADINCTVLEICYADILSNFLK